MLGHGPVAGLPVSAVNDVAGSVAPTAVAGFSSNASAPQIANYALVIGVGFFAASLIDGAVRTASSAEYVNGTHADAIYAAEAEKTTIWPSVRTPPAAVGVPAFVSVSRNEIQSDSEIWGSLRTPPAAPTGPVPAFVSIAPTEIQGGASVWNSVATQPVISSVPKFTSGSRDEYQGESAVWKSLRSPAAPSGILASFVYGAEQQGQNNNVGFVSPSLIDLTVRTASTSEYSYGTHAEAVYSAELQKVRVWRSAVAQTAVAVGVPPFVYGAEQSGQNGISSVYRAVIAADSRVAPQILSFEDADKFPPSFVWRSIVTQPPPPFTGVQPVVVLSGMPQVDPTQPPASVTQPLVFGEPPQPPAVDGVYPGSGHPVDWQGKRKKLTLKEQPEKHLRSILDKVVAEYYGEILESDAPKVAKAEAADTVRPYVSKDSKGARLPKPERVDWEKLQQDAEAVAALIAIWQDEVSRPFDDDDDEIIILLS